MLLEDQTMPCACNRKWSSAGIRKVRICVSSWESHISCDRKTASNFESPLAIGRLLPNILQLYTSVTGVLTVALVSHNQVSIHGNFSQTYMRLSVVLTVLALNMQL